jgi:hypothetical protein
LLFNLNGVWWSGVKAHKLLGVVECKVFELGIEHRFICAARTNEKDAECFFAGLQRQVASGNELGERCCDMLPDSYLVLGVKVALEALDPLLVCAGVNLGEYGLECANSGDEIVGQLSMANRAELECSGINRWCGWTRAPQCKEHRDCDDDDYESDLKTVHSGDALGSPEFA